MGKALRPEHITFFTARMDEHSRVVDWVVTPNEHEYLFTIRRKLSASESSLIVHLTDAYRYGLAEFFARPKQLRAGSFVVLGMPHASVDLEVVETAKTKRIGIGHVGKFMGALNYKNIWEYVPPEERKRKQQEQQRNRAQGYR